MAGTHKSLRHPPARVFENYVLTRLVEPGAGLTSLPQSRFAQVKGGAGSGANDNATSGIMPIGFDFEIDGIVYRNWSVNTNGWMVLVDPTASTFTFSDVLDGANWVNSEIKPTFSRDDVLLAPWFDDLRNVVNDPDDLIQTPFFYTSTKVARIKQGFEAPPIFVDSTSYGVSYCRDDHSLCGRRLIVRWASISNYIAPSSVLRFEVVLYENGTIEYRYTPRVNITDSSVRYEGATVGVFMPNGTHRFRDFSAGLGYRNTARQEYVYGGFAYDASYNDVDVITHVTASYNVQLMPYQHWPGLHSMGCVMTFSPPKNRRKVLPRREMASRDSMISYPLVARTGDSRRGTDAVSFDDRQSPNYGASSVVNYPTTLPRFFGGNGLGTLQRQDLFSGDFLATGSISRGAIDQYVIERPRQVSDGFNESARSEQAPATLTSEFFVTGSDPAYVSDGFTRSLRSKTHIRFSLPVNTSVAMPGASSSIYYYNARARAWQTPTNSTYIMGDVSVRPPSPNPYAGGDGAHAIVDAAAGRIIEDARGFGPIGNIVSSGSRAPSGANQTDAMIGSDYSHDALAAFIGKEYPKSVRNNSQYAAAADETFTLPINAPFLVEKAVFELPFAAGTGWFNDLTQCFVPLNNTGSFDFGGPGVTVALYRQVQFGTGQRAVTVRDLIMTSTVTHVNDLTSSIVVSNFVPSSSVFQVRPVGFLAYAGAPGAVVDNRGSSVFSGTVSVNATALNTAGVGLIYRQTFNSSGSANSANVMRLLTQVERLRLTGSSTSPETTVKVGYISPLGRSGTGFNQSGRCILGNEYVTLQGMVDQAGQTTSNPFYVGPGGLTAQQQDALSSSTFSAVAAAVVQHGSYFPSPYLVMPGDRLVLSVSKTRPAMYGGQSWFSGSTHDVTLPSGSVNVTLYGSQVAAGVEYHDSLNQRLSSNTVHEVIGNDPVIDQFEVNYLHEYSGSYTDDAMLGTLGVTTELSFSGGLPVRWINVQSVRDRRLSWLNARNVAPLSTSSSDVALTPSKSYRLEPWWERAGDVRLAAFVDSTERYWDSMMPSIKDCFAADGCGIFLSQEGAFGYSAQIDGTVTNTSSTPIGWIWLDYGIQSLLVGDYGPLINTNWNKAFPFEPRYRNVSRQLDIERSFVATYMYGGTPIVKQIAPTQVSGFFFGSTTMGSAISHGIPLSSVPCWNWYADVNMQRRSSSGYHVTGSMNRDDTSRVLFGFGDKNTHYVYDNGVLGSGHMPDTRDVEGPHAQSGVGYENNYYHVSPVVRGWKYGIYSGLPTYSKAYWRRGRFGQFRDMLEQRPYTKYYRTSDVRTDAVGTRPGHQPGAVTVRFLDPTSGRLTAPANTWSSNLSHECTSSLPFFDGQSTNRPSVDPTVLNLHPNVIKHDAQGNIHIE